MTLNSDKALLILTNRLISFLETHPSQLFHSTAHRGYDIPKAIHTPYICIQAGKVSGVWHSDILGNIVEVRSGLRHIAYAHVLHPVSKGTILHSGSSIGEIAGPSDNVATGSVTNGDHEHIAWETKAGGYYNGSVGKDPYSLVKSRLKYAKAAKIKLEKRIAKAERK